MRSNRRATSDSEQMAVTAAGGVLPAGTETTIYIGSLYEKVTKPSGVVEHKHSILAGGEAMAIRTLRSNGVNDVAGAIYWLVAFRGFRSSMTTSSYSSFAYRLVRSVWLGVPVLFVGFVAYVVTLNLAS